MASVLLQAGSGEVRIRSGAYRPASGTIAVDTNLVELGATVRDHKGKATGGLKASDFLVFDNLKQQKITFFSELRAPRPPEQQPASGSVGAAVGNAEQQPRYIALFFDDTHQGMAGFVRSQHAAEKLVSEGLLPGDRVGIFTGSGAVELDFTGDTKILLATLGKMRRHPDQPGNSGFGVCPTLTAYQAYVISNRLDLMATEVAAMDIKGCAPATPMELAMQLAKDAADAAWNQMRHQSTDVLDVLAQVVRRLGGEPGARILLMVSPGFVTTNDMERRTDGITEACLRAHIVVNGLDDEGLLGDGSESPESLGARGGPRAGWAGQTLMQRAQIVTEFMGDAAAATGGKLIQNNNDLAGSLRALTAMPEVSYQLGFSSADPPNGKYHKLKVTLAKGSGLAVSARAGYLSEVRASAPETAQQHIDRVVASREAIDQVPATLKVSASAGKDGRYRIQVDILIDAKRLPFGERDGASLQELTFVTVLEDAQGNFLEGKQALMDMALTSATRAGLEQKGIRAGTSFVAPKGDYRVREVIREAVHNHFGAYDTALQVR